MLLWLDDSAEALQIVNDVKVMLENKGENASHIMTYSGGNEVMQSIINDMDVVVTTKELESLEIIDSIQKEKVNVLFAYDY